MQYKDTFLAKIRQLAAIGLVVGGWLIYSELASVWAPEPDGETWLVMAARLAYVLLILIALGVLVAGIWWPRAFQHLARRAKSLIWLLLIGLIVLLAWLYLFSPLQAGLAAPWTQFIVALGLSRLAAWLLKPEQDHAFGWEELALALGLFLFPRVVQEARIIFPVAGLTIVALILWTGLFLALISLLYLPVGQRFRPWLVHFRTRLPARPWLAALIFLAPLIYRYVIGAGGYILYPNTRFMILAMAACLAAYLISEKSDRLINAKALAESSGWLVLSSAVTNLLLLVVNDPFSLSWSEGNRFYDYSLIFGQDLYNHPGEIVNPYTSPGRYILWGAMFLWKGLPIWAHRLWNTVLLTLPAILLAWLLTRKINSAWRIVVFLWIPAFFILIAPLHPPFMLILILVAAFAFHPSYFVRGSILVVASLYAGISRWTWILAPGAWGALIDLLLYYPGRQGSWLRRLMPSVAMAVLGAMPGLLLQASYVSQFSTGETLTSSQPLLWYRLLPNPTLGPGILLLMVVTTGPLVALLIDQSISGRWPLDVFQSLAVWGALIGFLGAGLVISTKIGGGGDLHNLDMYIGTVILITTLLLSGSPAAGEEFRGLSLARMPAWLWAMLAFLLLQPLYLFTPLNPSAGYHKWLDLLSRDQSSSVLSTIRTEVDDASRQGEVLFIDQRQLLTFGYIDKIPFVPEYEKKYMMDQAMAGNKSYFLPYYQDLARQRFKLIVSEILRANLKDYGVFSEENDAWVTWVSAPTLCFYEPIMTEKSVGVQLLVPRQVPKNCEKYLQQVEP